MGDELKWLLKEEGGGGDIFESSDISPESAPSHVCLLLLWCFLLNKTACTTVGVLLEGKHPLQQLCSNLGGGLGLNSRLHGPIFGRLWYMNCYKVTCGTHNICFCSTKKTFTVTLQ